MAYVPLVVLFYMGMKVYLVDTSHTAEELQLILGRMTGEGRGYMYSTCSCLLFYPIN